MTVLDWLDTLPDGSVVGAYNPDMQGAPGHKPGTAWMWRKENGEWIIVGGGYHGTAYVATHPNLTLIHNPTPVHDATPQPAFDREKAERIWAGVPYGDGTLPGRRPKRVGTIPPETLAEMNRP